MSTQYEIVYNTNIIVEDPTDLAALCIFYDKVLMPWENHWRGNEFIMFRKDELSGRLFANPDPRGMPYFKFLKDGQWYHGTDIGVHWYNENRVLFDEKVIDQLDTPPPRFKFDPGFELTDLATRIFRSSYVFYDFDDPNQYYVSRGILGK